MNREQMVLEARYPGLQEITERYSNIGEAPAQQVARPTNEAEFNALPKGAIFIDPEDGKQYRK